MPRKPDDRPRAGAPRRSADPRLYLVIGGEKFPRPGLETVFIDAKPGGHARGEAVAGAVETRSETVVTSGCACKPVAIPVCACMKVYPAAPVRGCAAHTSSTGTTTYGCRCAPVH